MRNKILKSIYFLGVFFAIIFLFNNFAFSQEYELLWSRISAGSSEQASDSYEVKASVGGITNVDSESANFSIQSVFTPPDSMPAVPFAGAVSMVSFPLIPESNDAYFLFGSGFDLAKWVQSENTYHYYSKTPQDSIMQLNAGQGYWLKLDSGKTINVYGSLVSESSNYTITLKQGWNQIGNPFTFNINFADIKVRYNGETKTLAEAADAHWLGNYAFAYPNQTTGYQLIHPTIVGAIRILEPWFGYWVNSAFDLEILIPPTKATKAKEIESDDNFNLKITASIDDLKENIIVGKDKQNQLIPLPPSPLQNNLEIYLQRGESKYLAEITNDITNYEFVVKAEENKKVKLEFSTTNLDDYHLYLTDTQEGKESEVTNNYEFTSNGSERKFKLQISKADKSLLSQSITLENITIFPNPLTKNVNLNIEAKFSNGLPVSADIEIYNTNGKLISKENTLPEYQGKGKVRLSSPNLNNSITALPNGIYFGRITFYNVNNEKVSKVVKIAVMK